MRRSHFLPLMLLGLPALSNACSIARREPGTPLDVPAALIEVRVVEERTVTNYEYRPGRFIEGQEIIVEVLRTLIGKRPEAERITLRHHTMMSACGREYPLNARLLLADFPDSGPYDYYAVAYEGERFQSAFGAIADVDDPRRTSRKPGLERVHLRGRISDSAASKLLFKSGLDPRDDCEIVAAGKFAHVACGTSLDGTADRIVLFEKLETLATNTWVEIARYGPGISPVASSADSTW